MTYREYSDTKYALSIEISKCEKILDSVANMDEGPTRDAYTKYHTTRLAQLRKEYRELFVGYYGEPDELERYRLGI